jgi:hypothetical protein
MTDTDNTAETIEDRLARLENFDRGRPPMSATWPISAPVLSPQRRAQFERWQARQADIQRRLREAEEARLSDAERQRRAAYAANAPKRAAATAELSKLQVELRRTRDEVEVLMRRQRELLDVLREFEC